jgi:hypothetical protein
VARPHPPLCRGPRRRPTTFGGIQLPEPETFETELEEVATSQTVTIPDGQLARVGVATTTLIVAGPDALAAAAAAAAETVLVAGLQSPHKWKAEDRTGSPALDQLVRDARDTTVILCLGDLADADVWDSAKGLADHLMFIGAKAVTHASTAGVDLGTQLAARPSDKARELYLAGMLLAAGKLGRRPASANSGSAAAMRQSIAPTVDVEAGLTYLGSGDSRQVLMEAAIYRRKTFRVYDDRKDPAGNQAIIMHDLEVAVAGPAGGVRIHPVKEALDAHLCDPRRILNRISGGSSVVISADQSAGRHIDAAIRHHDADLVIDEIPVIRRTGWLTIHGVTGFCMPNGWMTADGLSNRARSKLIKIYEHLRFPDTATITPAEERAAASNELALMDELTDINLWAGPWGIAMHSVSGLGVAAVTAIHGARGSGKTTLMQGILASLSPVYGTKVGSRPIASMDQTPANVAKVGIGLDGLFLLVDDARKVKGQYAIEQGAKLVELIVRPGYGGGGARAIGAEYDPATNSWGPAVPDLSNPAMGIVGEHLPGGEDLESTIERLWSVGIERDFNIFRSGNSRIFEKLAEADHPNRHLACFIAWCAGKIARLDGGFDEWVSSWVAERQSIEDSRTHLPISTRVREVSAVPEVGMLIWLTYLRELDIITRARFDALISEIHTRFNEVALIHGTEHLSGKDVAEHQSILDSLRGGLASRQFWLEGAFIVNPDAPASDFQQAFVDAISGDPADPRQQLLGGHIRTRSGGEFVAILPAVALKLLNAEGKHKGITESELFRAFQSVSLKDTGKRFKTAVISGVRSKTLAIPREVWTSAEDDVETDIAPRAVWSIPIPDAAREQVAA